MPTLHCSSNASIVYHHARERPANPVLSRDGDIEQPDGERHRSALAGATPRSQPATAPAAHAAATAGAAAGTARRGRSLPGPERLRAGDLRAAAAVAALTKWLSSFKAEFGFGH